MVTRDERIEYLRESLAECIRMINVLDAEYENEPDAAERDAIEARLARWEEHAGDLEGKLLMSLFADVELGFPSPS